MKLQLGDYDSWANLIVSNVRTTGEELHCENKLKLHCSVLTQYLHLSATYITVLQCELLL